MMFDRRDARAILDLARETVPSLGPFRAVAGVLAGEPGEPFDGGDGAVAVDGCGWAWAYALRGGGGHAGYLVVGAAAEPSAHEQLLLRILARQTGAALGSAALHRRELETATELRRVTVELAAANAQLSASVADLEQRRRTHEVLTAVAASGAGERGIAEAVHDLTGLPVAVEDRFGNVRAWSGPGRTPARRSGQRRDGLLARARASTRPLRDRDRVIALAQPRDEVLGVLVLVDPDRRAGEHQLVALEEGAVVLAMELAHLRALAETELRLRRDLVDDLLSGTADDESAVPRAAALGHDLAAPHHVLLVDWASGAPDGAVEQAVERAAGTVLRTHVLLARRPGGLVAIVPRPAEDAAQRWRDLHAAVARRLRSDDGSIGVGGVALLPSQLARSYDEARRALRIRQAPRVPAGVTSYEELGVYKLLAGQDTGEAEHFVREWLGVLLDYDAANHTDLVRTLWQYYECGGNYDGTAGALVIHRSTLRYRLRRIRELTGHDLNAVDSKLNLHVATRAWHVLGGWS
ncbi:hypothetical protein BJF78_11880 [Pseudonocardia sp. CNS-139]|nr:hypothetical protein BJF78_11880 [Pseudonocardia sp. CNS-139]